MSCHVESAISFACSGEPLIGIVSEPARGDPADIGIVIIVGGPQYRAGSHRQFTLMARHLAERGFSSLRFDYRSMGDSGGTARDFLNVNADIAAAITALQTARPHVRQVVLWGLCDAASAALLYAGSQADARIRGLCLINPWARSTASLAKATVKHYYRRRLLQKEFWAKLTSGQLGMSVVRTLLQNVRNSFPGTAESTNHENSGAFQDRMLSALIGRPIACLLILSSADQTANEFIEYARTAGAWDTLLKQRNVHIRTIDGADHTLSRSQHQSQMFDDVAAWLAPMISPSFANHQVALT